MLKRDFEVTPIPVQIRATHASRKVLQGCFLNRETRYVFKLAVSIEEDFYLDRSCP